MPTNRDWLEHTEKAAWDTVGALREQIATERARADRLARIEPTPPRLAELLDEAREALSIQSQAPAAVIEQLVERLGQTTAERAYAPGAVARVAVAVEVRDGRSRRRGWRPEGVCARRFVRTWSCTGE